jgi:TonB family protein
MFDFAISQNKRKKLPRRLYFSLIISCLAHVSLILLINQFPELLRGGFYHNFRPFSFLGNSSKDELENLRTITVLRDLPMAAPSAATLKKYLTDLKEKGEKNGTTTVRIRWGDEQNAALNKMTDPVTKISPELKQSIPLPIQESAKTDASSGTAASGGNGPLKLPPSGQSPKTETALPLPSSTSTPTDSLSPGNPSPPNKSINVFDNEQKAIRSKESGFFDTQGFPLGEYARLIKQRIEGKWFIPSNLRNSQGQTTIVFYISQDGNYTDCRIVSSSGSNSLDLAALKAVIDSNPFPPLPKGFPGDHIGAKFVLSYNEP